MSYTFRPYLPEDLNFIRSSWTKSYYWGTTGKLLSKETFNHYHRPIMDRILIKPNLAIIICAATSDPNLIIGWIATEALLEAEGQILHYIYVKEAFKGEKIARELFKRAIHYPPIFLSHMTTKAQKIIDRKPMDVYFTPHLI